MSEQVDVAVENNGTSEAVSSPPTATQEQPPGTAEKLNNTGSVGFKVTKGDGTVIEGEPTPAEGTPPPVVVPRVEVNMNFKIHTPIRDFLEAQSKKMRLPLEEIYGSLVEDAFKMHYNKLCPYCGDQKFKWLNERKREVELNQKLKAMKAKRIKKAKKDARRRNRG